MASLRGHGGSRCPDGIGRKADATPGSHYHRPVQTLAQIKELLESRGLAPKKSLGQNFLVDQNLIRKLVDSGLGHAAGTRTVSEPTVSGTDHSVVLEVGPGTGTLTEELLSRGCRVIACEMDDGLAAMLAERAPTLPGGDRLSVVRGDCLTRTRELNPEVLAAVGNAAEYRLIANLPYGAATPLMSELLVHHPRCVALAVTIQKEVADRLLAGPGTGDYGGLSVVAQAVASVRRIATLPRECFWPRPDVTSAMLLLERLATPATNDIGALSEFCRVIFSQRRKQLGGVLGSAGVAKPAEWPEGVRPDLRAEQLTVGQIESLRLACGPAAPR